MRLGDRGLLRVLGRLRAAGLTASEGGSYTLTTLGEQRARHLVRAHRLLERYLADEARLPLTSVHKVAEKLEHRLSEADADRLSASMGHPERDPHGDPIPSAGEGSDDPGEPITHWHVGQEGRIVHLEDEPERHVQCPRPPRPAAGPGLPRPRESPAMRSACWWRIAR